MTIAERHQLDRAVASKPKAKPRKPFPAGKCLFWLLFLAGAAAAFWFFCREEAWFPEQLRPPQPPPPAGKVLISPARPANPSL